MKKTIQTSSNIPTDINISNAMVHVLDLEGTEPILTEYMLTLDDEIYKLLFKQIEGFFKDKRLKFARFGEYRSLIPKIRDTFLETSDFIAASKDLAKLLFKSMENNKELSSCDLFVFNVITDQGAMLGCLKVDFTTGVQHQIETIENKIGIKLESNHNSLPFKAKFDKGAFILLNKNKDFDLFIIDEVKAPKKDEDIYCQDYFSKRFLLCENIEDTRTITNDFINRTEKFIKKEINDAEQQEAAKKQLRKSIKNQEVNIYEFAEEVFKDSNVQEKYCESINDISKVQDLEFDPVICEKVLDNISLKLVHETFDVEIKLSEEVYNDINKFEVVKNGDGTVNFIIKNITSF